MGALRSCNIVRRGIAEVVFDNVEDAQSAVTRYNGRELDGCPMAVRMVTPVVAGSSTATTASTPAPSTPRGFP